MHGWPVESDWTKHLSEALSGDAFHQTLNFVKTERQSFQVFPECAAVFNAFRLTPFSQTRVVILGQDPYHGPSQAHGLSFSVMPGNKLPPSLRNIYKELASDLDCELPRCGDLTHWAKQGVLLLNTVLTVRQGEANSHRKRGWESFTDAVISKLSERSEPVIFLLWGKPAQQKAAKVDSRHAVLMSPHPSPLSAHRGFFDSRPFSKINKLLEQTGQPVIEWIAHSNP